MQRLLKINSLDEDNILIEFEALFNKWLTNLRESNISIVEITKKGYVLSHIFQWIIHIKDSETTTGDLVFNISKYGEKYYLQIHFETGLEPLKTLILHIIKEDVYSLEELLNKASIDIQVSKYDGLEELLRGWRHGEASSIYIFKEYHWAAPLEPAICEIIRKVLKFDDDKGMVSSLIFDLTQADYGLEYYVYFKDALKEKIKISSEDYLKLFIQECINIAEECIQSIDITNKKNILEDMFYTKQALFDSGRYMMSNYNTNFVEEALHSEGYDASYYSENFVSINIENTPKSILVKLDTRVAHLLIYASSEIQFEKTQMDDFIKLAQYFSKIYKFVILQIGQRCNLVSFTTGLYLKGITLNSKLLSSLVEQTHQARLKLIPYFQILARKEMSIEKIIERYHQNL